MCCCVLLHHFSLPESAFLLLYPCLVFWCNCRVVARGGVGLVLERRFWFHGWCREVSGNFKEIITGVGSYQCSSRKNESPTLKVHLKVCA